MILEVAEIHVKDGTGKAFESALQQAQPVLMGTEGYIRHELRGSMEDENRYLLFVEWESLEAHLVNFRESERYLEWRKIISPFFAQSPLVEHFDVRVEGEKA